MFYAVILIIAGILQGFMVSFNGQLGNYYSLFGICFFVHVIPVVILLIHMKLIKKEKIFLYNGVPKYIFTVGFMGVAMIASSSYCTLKIGARALSSLSTVGQMISSAMVDHYGWFGAKQRKFQLKEIPCYLLVLIGALLVVNG